MGDTTGHGAAGATAPACISGTGRSDGAETDIRDGKGIGTRRDAGTRRAGRFDSGPPTPLPRLRRGIPHQRQLIPPADSVGYGGKYERGSVGGENVSAAETTTAPSGVYSPSVSSEPCADSDLSTEASETSLSASVFQFLRRCGLRRANLNRTWSDIELTRSWNELERAREQLVKKQLALPGRQDA